ncbi:MAG: helix-turn-helix domain-containing protein [Shewanella sp.]|nr:helix-turn-helix domain-containing protein [Shewanella sp.]MCF1437191.1 helix-turn-helix domain-containing protein [Shewanella sp.]
MDWKERTQRLMLEKGWNQYDLAEHAGYSQSNIARLMKESTPPTQKALSKLAKALGVDESYLLSDSNTHSFPARPILAPGQVKPWLTNALSKENISEWVADSSSSSKRTYALHLSPIDSIPGARNGSFVVIDPDLPRRINSVIACLLATGVMVVRTLITSAGQYYLESLNNSNIPPLQVDLDDPNVHYLGTVTMTIIYDVDQKY